MLRPFIVWKTARRDAATWKDAPEWWNRYRRLGKRYTGVMDWDRTVRS